MTTINLGEQHERVMAYLRQREAGYRMRDDQQRRENSETKQVLLLVWLVVTAALIIVAGASIVNNWP